MKCTIVCFILWPLAVLALERVELDKMLTAAAAAQSNAYVEARNRILDVGTNALSLLVNAGCDTKRSPQERLVARICYEHISRSNDLAELRNLDWRTYPPYQPKERGQLIIKMLSDGTHETEVQPSGANLVPVTGRSSLMGDYVVPECQRVGLWYYFIELTWKQTQEGPLKSPDARFAEKWPVWCRLALKGQPEESYLLLAKVERLKIDSTLENRENVQFYRDLLQAKDADAVPLLIQRYDVFNKREVTGPELFAGRHAELYRGMFEPLLSLADSRHIEMLEKFVTTHEALANLKPRLAEVRARPAQTPMTDPSFRLGSAPVKFP